MCNGSISSMMDTAEFHQAMVNHNSSKMPPISYYESFETFVQNLAPLTLSNSGEISQNPVSLCTIPKTTSNLCSEDCERDRIEGGHNNMPKEGEQGGIGGMSHDEEVKSLQDLVELLKARLDAIQRVLEIQEEEVCKRVAEEGDEKSLSAYEQLLNRWRREVCILILKQRVDAFQVEQRQLQHTQKEQHLNVQLHEARALVEVLKQKERNLQAEIAILTTSTKVAEMTMKSECARSKVEMEGTLKYSTKAAAKAILFLVESSSSVMSIHFERMSDASCRLDIFGKRMFFAEQQVAMVAGLISSDLNPQGKCVVRRRKGDAEHAHLDRRRDQVIGVQSITVDHAGRASQLEMLLAATKNQLADECLHAQELQERLTKSEIDARDSMNRATKRAHEQAEHDLVAIKRQHVQAMQSVQQKLVKLQAEQAKGIVAYHQLERKMSQQQQDFTQTLSQRDSEFKRSLDAKEVEVNGLLDEQNALLIKLKKFWRPILTSSSSKVFNEKNLRSASQTSRPDSRETSQAEDRKSHSPQKNVSHSQSIETQTDEYQNKKKRHGKHEKFQECDSGLQHYDTSLSEIKDGRASSSRLSTPNRNWRGKSNRQRPKRSEEDLISSYLTKLQKAYVKSEEDLSTQFMSTRSLDSILNMTQEDKAPPSTSLQKQVHQNVIVEAINTPHHSSVGSKDSSDCNILKPKNVPEYIICVPRRQSSHGCGETGFFVKPRRRKRVVDPNRLLRVKLDNLEALSETLLDHGRGL